MACMTNRILIMPFFCPHGTVKHSSGRHIYTFEETFDSEIFCKNFDLIEFKNVKKAPKRVFHIRNENSSEIKQSKWYLSLYNKVYDLNYKMLDLPCEYLGKPWFSSEKDFNYLNSIDDDVLCICGMFNNIKLSSCGRNHCLNCSRGGPFLNIYDKISISMIRSSKVRYEALEFVSKTFDNENFIAFHMRTSDTVSKKPFTEVYLGYTEAEIYNSIIYLANKFYISHDNIFLACPPSALKVKDVKLFNTHLFKKYKNNKNLEPYTISLIEQEICSISTIFIRSITNTPHIPKNILDHPGEQGLMILE